MRVLLFLSILITFLVSQRYGYCQQGIPKFSHITTNEGLSDNYVQDVFQDSYGYLWFATWNGLTKYDGYTYINYHHNVTDSHSLSGNRIHEIHENSKQELWIISTDGGLMKYNREQDNFINFLISSNDSTAYLKNHILNFVIDIYDQIWVSSNYGIGMLDNQLKWHWFKELRLSKLTAIANYQLQLDNQKHVWCASSTSNLYCYNYKTQKNEIVAKWFSQKIHLQSGVLSMFFDSNNQLWIGTKGDGLWCINENKNTVIQYTTQNSKLLSNEIAAIYEDSKKNIWIGTVNGGISVFPEHSTTLITYFQNEYNSQSINSNSISSITEDSGGNIWFGTHGGGVNCLGFKENLIQHYRRDITNPNSLSNNYVSCFYESHEKQLWIGTDGGGLNLFNRDKNNFYNYSTTHGAGSSVILNISPDDNSNLWLSTWGGGIMHFNTKTLKFQNFNPDINKKDWISYPHAKWVLYDNDTVWVSTHGDGVNLYLIKQKKFLTKNSPNTPFDLYIPQWGNKILKDKRGWLWFITNNGLYLWNRKKLQTFTYHSTEQETISSNVVTDGFEDSEGNLWFGTNEGLDKFEPTLGTFIRYRNKYPSLPINVKKILEDKQRNLWISSSTGIYKFNPQTGRIQNYNIFDGLQGNQFFDRSGIVTQNGDLYFGGLSGFNILRPELLKSNTQIPQVYLTDFQIFNQSQKVNTHKSPLSKDISVTQEIVIDYLRSKMISFEYVALNYIATKKNKYAYTLEGFDTEWHSVGNERKATYTNLPPGNYIFKVKAANNDGVWNTKGIQVRLTILPPWYLTLWFRITSIIFISSIIVGFYFYRTRSMRLQNKILEENVQERTKELEKKNELLLESNHTKDKFFSIISHDLKNPMGSVIGLSELLMNNFSRYPEEKKILFIKTIHESTTHLYELLVNLLEWARSQTGAIRYNPQQFSLNEITSETITLLTDFASKKEIEIQNNTKNDSTIFADENMVKTIIRNILSNSIKFTPRGGKITISNTTKNNRTIICIADTGIGMSELQVANLFTMGKSVSTHGTENESGTGLGLLLCKEFALRHNGNIFVESTQNSGSQFYIELPANQ